MGKGGVGRTSLSAALALAHAQRGERVGLASLASATELEHAVRAGWGAPPATLQFFHLEARALVDNVLRRLMPIPALTQLVTSHPAYDAVYSVAPGVKELAVLHRLLELADLDAFDRLIVDGYATGHGTHFLEAPRRSARMLVGQLADRARRIDAALMDGARTSVLLVTTLEEMPVRETQELAGQLQAGGFRLDGILANRSVEHIFSSPGATQALARLEERAVASRVGSELGAPWRSVQRFARAGRYFEARAQEQEAHLTALRGLGAPLVRVPLLPLEEGRLRFMAARLAEAGL